MHNSSMETVDTEPRKTNSLPKEMEEYIRSLPPSWQNNAKQIVRSDVERIMKLNKNLSAKILNDKYGTGYEHRSGIDYGNEINN